MRRNWVWRSSADGLTGSNRYPSGRRFPRKKEWIGRKGTRQAQLRKDSNDLFYEGLLHDDASTRNKIVRGGLGQSALLVLDTSAAAPWCSRLSGGGRFNLYHAVLTARAAQKIIESTGAEYKIGIISPYAAQARMIGKILLDMGLEKQVRVATVHRYQGGEEDIILFDTVEGMGVKIAPMLDDTHKDSDARLLLNVALTRAKCQIVLIANRQYLGQQLSHDATLSKLLARFEADGQVLSSDQIVDSFFVKDYEHAVEQALLASTSNDGAPPEGSLHSERNFYAAFFADLRQAQREVIILSPFLSTRRSGQFIELLRVLVRRGVAVRLFTRPAKEQTGDLALHSTVVIEQMQALGVQVTERPKMHQKVAIIDRTVAWEGSLNILSHRDSGEQMRRLPFTTAVNETIRLFDLDEAPSATSSRKSEPIQTMEPCPICSQKMVVRVSQYGPFLSCPTRICEGKRSIGHRDRVKTEAVCKTCGSAMLIRNGSRGPFMGCSGYPKCKETASLR